MVNFHYKRSGGYSLGTFLGFLLGISIIIFLFSVIWKWVIVMPVTVLLMAFGIDHLKITVFFSNLIGHLVIISMLILYTASFTSEEGNFVPYAITAGLFFLFSCLQDLGNNDETVDLFPVRFSALILGLIFYLITIIYPTIAVNGISITLLEWIQKINEINVLSWIINIVGIIYVFSMLFMGVIALFGLIALVTNELKSFLLHRKIKNEQP